MPAPKLAPGTKAPALKGTTDQGDFDLAAHRGHPVVIYFYPKDMTPGGTTEACDFRDRQPRLEQLGAIVVGVSKDSAKRHAKFREQQGLNFPLVADEDGSICEAWGVWREKKNYGKAYMGIVRATFLVDGSGKIAQVWDPVKVKGHADAVLEAVQGLTR